jgi:ATP-dependent DNA ligase
VRRGWRSATSKSHPSEQLLGPKAPPASIPRSIAMGLEGIVSKRLSAPYRSGPSRDWIKVKNSDSPAMVIHREENW